MCLNTIADWSGLIILLPMSNLGNYSPYNKTYKFILFQNQAYHQRNKRNASPCVRTNLRHSLSRRKNPQNFDLHLSNLSPTSSPRNMASFVDVNTSRSALFEGGKQIQNSMIDRPKRIVHKHWSFEKFNKAKINRQNLQMLGRVLNASCEVVSNKRSKKSFDRHLKYSDIRARYDQRGQRKDSVPLLKSEKLCPTLSEYQRSGLASRFVNMDMSMMSGKPSTAPGGMRRSYISNASPSPQ